MATRFSNLGKGIRPTLAVVSDKITYKAEKKENQLPSLDEHGVIGDQVTM